MAIEQGRGLSVGPNPLEFPQNSTQRELYRLFYLSFRFSQGITELQASLFQWLKAERYLDSIAIPHELPSVIAHTSAPRRHDVSGHMHQGHSLRHMWEELSATKDKEVETGGEELAEKIYRYMLDREIYYQSKRRPGREPDASFVADSSSDPHASLLRRHAIIGVPTGHAAYDVLFGRIKDVIQRDANSNPSLRQLKDSWEKNHANESFFPTLESL